MGVVVSVSDALLALSDHWANLPRSSPLLEPLLNKGWLEMYPHRNPRRASYRLTKAGLAEREKRSE